MKRLGEVGQEEGLHEDIPLGPDAADGSQEGTEDVEVAPGQRGLALVVVLQLTHQVVHHPSREAEVGDEGLEVVGAEVTSHQGHIAALLEEDSRQARHRIARWLGLVLLDDCLDGRRALCRRVKMGVSRSI